MIAVLITLTPGGWNEGIDCQISTVWLQYCQSWMWQHNGIWHLSWLRHSTNDQNWPMSGPRIQSTGITGHFHNRVWKDHQQVCDGRLKAFQIQDPMVLENTFGYSASHHHCLQWHVPLYSQCYAIFTWEENSMEGRLILCCKECVTEGVQILCGSYSNNWSVFHFGTHSWFFLEHQQQP